MTPWNDAHQRYELWIEVRDLADDLRALADRLAALDPELRVIRDVLEGRHPANDTLDDDPPIDIPF